MTIRLPARIFFVLSVAAVVSILTLVQIQQSSNVVLSLSASSAASEAVDYANTILTSSTNIDNEQRQHHRRRRRIHRNILEYVDTNPETTCPNGLYLVNDTRLDNLLASKNSDSSSTLLSSSKIVIPKIIHITSKSRCMTKEFSSNIDKWRLPGYSVLIHNDDAVDELLNSYFPEFPELQKVVHCLVSGAGKADLWRVLILWEYGGIYTDMDNIPNISFLNGSIINHQKDDSWFVVEQGGWLSQYFMVSTSHHPLMYFVVHKIIQRLYSLNDVDTQYVPRSTGPGALKYGFINFMNDQGPNIYEGFGNCNSKYKYKYGTVTEGRYVGFNNRTVTIRGKRGNSQEYIIRENIKTKKHMYNEMNMTHFSDYEKQQKKKQKQQQQQQQDIESCFRRIYQRDPWLSS